MRWLGVILVLIVVGRMREVASDLMIVGGCRFCWKQASRLQIVFESFYLKRV